MIGGGWVARLVQNGIDTAVYDPDPEAERKIREVLDLADRALSRLTNAPRTAEGKLHFAGTLEEAVDGAEFIQESAHEGLDGK